MKNAKQTLIEKLEALQSHDCTEEAHIIADDLLVEYIGDSEIAKAYETIGKCYA